MEANTHLEETDNGITMRPAYKDRHEQPLPLDQRDRG
jgi:hypothetical protein